MWDRHRRAIAAIAITHRFATRWAVLVTLQNLANKKGRNLAVSSFFKPADPLKGARGKQRRKPRCFYTGKPKPSLRKLHLRLDDLTTTVHTGLQIDVVRAMQFAGFFVFAVRARGELVV
ncbi:hypothetical protein TMES_09040 [Thalassospira mesophila]|uniref:Uncharacterized protein n=1 Tax=Thalassospira mesophila TaxID=1293891 RepID=A0A1Y2L0X0_9PROT|nr:hypothetical protein TMES_09040 [Thalassospira mesophila]